MHAPVLLLAALAGHGLAGPIMEKATSALTKRAQPVYPAAPDGMYYLSIGTQQTLTGSGHGTFIYFTASTDVCAPTAPVDDTPSCVSTDFKYSIIEPGAFNSCDEIQGAQKDTWDANLAFRGSVDPADYPNQFSTHGLGRCAQQGSINFFRQADGSFRAESSDGVGVARCFEADHSDQTIGWDSYCPGPFQAQTALRLLECSGNICL